MIRYCRTGWGPQSWALLWCRVGLVLLCAVLFFAGSAAAAPAGLRVWLLPDPDASLDSAGALAPAAASHYRLVPDNTVALSGDSGAWWLRLEFPPDWTPPPDPQDLRLDFDWPNFWEWGEIRDLSFFAPTAEGGFSEAVHVAAGRTAAAFDRVEPYTFPLRHCLSAEAPCLLRIASSPVQFTLQVRDGAERLQAERRAIFTFSLYYGIMFSLVVFNLAMFFTLGEKGYLWFCAYAAAEAGLFLYTNGILFLLLQAEDLLLLSRRGNMLLGLIALFTGQFARTFLGAAPALRRWDLAIKAYMAFGVLVAGLSFLPGAGYDFAKNVALGTALGPYIVIGAGIASWRQGQRQLSCFLGAWVAWAVGGLVSALAYAQVLPVNWLTFNSFQATSALAGILLTLALAQRVGVIRREREVAKATAQAKSRFLATMSHEIRTPMNSILGLTDLVLHTELDPRQRDCLETVRESGSHMLQLLNDILDFSKLEARRMVVETVDFSLHALLRSLVKGLDVQAQAGGVRLALELDPALPDCVRGDPARLRQILVNLVGNAIKFSPQGRVRVVVDTPQAPPNQEGPIRFRVIDSGVGIPPEQQTRIFEQFSQAESSTARKFGGTGLGLAIAKELAELMGGTLGVNSAPGQGSEFTLHVPLPSGDPSALGSAAEPEQAPRVGGAPLRILLADDNRANIKVAGLHLERLGYRVDSVETGKAALEALARRRYDLVLMDVEMPEMDGLEATRRIRAGEQGVLDPTVPIVGLSAFSQGEMADRCRLCGMSDYAVKPVNFHELAVVISRLVRGRSPVTPAPLPEGSCAEPEGPAVYDPEAALTALGITREQLAQILVISLEELAQLRRELGRGLERGDIPHAARQVHTMRSSAGTIGAMRLFQATRPLERHLRTQGLEGHAPLLQVLDAEFAALARALPVDLGELLLQR